MRKRFAYVVRNEDGIIVVCGSRTLAMTMAVEHVVHALDRGNIDYDYDIDVQKKGCARVHCSVTATAEVERHSLITK